MKDYNHPGVFGVKISNTWIYGISSFYRVGDISLAIVNNSAIIGETLECCFVLEICYMIHYVICSYGSWNTRTYWLYNMGIFNS